MGRIAAFFEGEDWFHPDIPSAIILSEFDGDVADNGGQVVYDEIVMQARNHSMASFVYLHGANHNYFSRYHQRDDGTFQAPEVRRLSRAEQEDFLAHYAAAFLTVVTGERIPWGTFNPSQPQPNAMFGHSVTASTYLSGLQRIVAVPSPSSAAQVSAAGFATVAFYMQRWNADGLFNHPGVINLPDEQLPLYDLQWTGAGAVSFPTENGDFAGHQAISLYVAMDSSSALNPAKANQAFTVTLTDDTGTARSVVIPAGTAALSRHHGYETYDEWMARPMWVGNTPLGELRVPLAYFDGLNIAAIASLTIRFDQTPSGAVMLSGMFLK